MIANVNSGPGRPEKYGAVHVRIFKEIVRTMGLRAGCKFLREKGIKINGKLRKLEISQVTLSKYVRRSDELTGEAVMLSPGRPANKGLNFTVDSLNEFDKAVGKPVKSNSQKSKTKPKAKIIKKAGPGRPKKTLVADGARRGRPRKSA